MSDQKHPRRLAELSRRGLLRVVAAGGASTLTAPFLWRRAEGAQSIVCADPGGVYSTAFAEAFYKPFEKETGIQVVSVGRPGNPSAQIKAQVEAKSYQWDMSAGITSDIQLLLIENGLLDKLDLGGPDVAAIPANMKSDYYLANGVVTFLLAYRTDRLGGKNLESFADIWDVQKFPARRALRKFARDTIEIAMRADGVVGGPDIYKALSAPGGWDRAFKKLDQIKSQIVVWWDAAPQSAQLLSTGEVDICPTFNARAQNAIDAGAPVRVVWEGGFYSAEGWVVLKGTPKADLCRQFVKFCARADRQAAYTRTLTNGPTNPEAYKHIEKKQAELLPTYPANFKGTAELDNAFWGTHKDTAGARFNEWLLKA
ncbi:MAG: ABC transporter substrate-binding protein [Alphaproteobacteria bacterium]|nr:ABC transporter substrate-binding protein [Alphaproteobacteria bacterium]